MAGFEVSINGRFWVSPEGATARGGAARKRDVRSGALPIAGTNGALKAASITGTASGSTAGV